MKGRHDHRESEPMPGGEASPRVPLSGAALAMWEHLHPLLMADGLATELDSATLTAACEWWANYRFWMEAEGIKERERTSNAACAWKQFDKIASKFGLTPTDRVGMVSGKRTERDEIEELLA